MLIASLIIGLSFSAQAQKSSKNALGVRLGDNDGFGGEISYQRALSDNNRIEADLGWRNSKDVDAFKLTGIYQWVWNLDGGLNWYAGLGGGLGSWNYDDNHGINDNGTFGFVAGDLGIEYNFDFPLQVSLDIRPEIYLNSSSYVDDNFGTDVALGVRYRF